MTMNDHRWYENPARKCVDEFGNPIEEFTDLNLLPRGHNIRRVKIAELVAACETCPVFRPCREDFLGKVKDWEHYGIQAGMVGKK